ncbi:hypothetical protein HHK36_010477 [Tetracentron sinense]|uniref:non-specific serine/threonine protein kinase n=1 Tax=Tetracentron sinense TaxID=13715 RepID=A0A834ZH11_TETSI|nr:hypothetical protein HHK36_010477 [Tetracentron sinense]
MKPYSIILLWFLLIIAGFSASIGDPSPSPSQISETSVLNRTGDDLKQFNHPATNSLLLPTAKDDTLLFVGLDGMIYLAESDSGKPLWTFPSGPSIYSSYQDFLNHDSDKENASLLNNDFFVDCGDDWELYMQSRHFGKVKLSVTAEEYIKSTPLISEDGGITLGSKRTTVFFVDAKTGRLIHTFRSADSPSISGLQNDEEKRVLLREDMEEWVESGAVDLKTVVQPLYITRTDYVLEYFAPNSAKVLWNMTIAEFGAAYPCQGIENSFGEASFNSGYERGSEHKGDIKMPLPCRAEAIVHRIRDHSSLKSFSVLGLPKAHSGGIVLSLPPPNHSPRLQFEGLPEHRHKAKGDVVLPLPSPKTLNSGNSDTDGGDMNLPYSEIDDVVKENLVRVNNAGKPNLVNMLLEVIPGSRVLSYILFVALMGFVLYYRSPAVREQSKFNKQANNLKGKTVVPRRKRARKLGNNKSSVSIEKNDKHISSENEDGEITGLSHIERDDWKPWLSHTNLVDGGVDGRRIGKLLVSKKEIAKGSNGTVVLEGIYDGRPVAVKRLVQAHNDVAFKEIQNLIASDQHPNIVRWYGVEYDLDFVYLSLERCTCSLNDLIQIHSDSSLNSIYTGGHATSSINESNDHLNSMNGYNKDIELWKANGYPSSQLLKLMRDVVFGLAHLHELGIVHRDLKPQNVLIIKEKSICAKLSDMGISKRLLKDMSSLGHNVTGYGSSGWQAPEQLLQGRQTRAIDLFSLGCLLFFCITGGRHPFGDHLERDINIVKNRVDLFLVESIPEAVDLFSHLLDPNPELRPKALEVLQHPLFWSSETRLSFLRDTSDRVELEDRENESELLKALESVAPIALGGKWDEKMETAFITNIGRYRRYKFDSVRDLLRVIRNKLNHYRELPQEIQEILGTVPEGFDGYFANRFPKLLTEVFNVVCRYCKEDECFWKYFNSEL